MLQQWLEVLKPHWRALGVISYCLTRIWMLKRQRRWQSKLLAQEQQRHIASQNETLKTVLTAFASGEQPMLDDLLSSVERDWSLKSSAQSYAPGTYDDEPTALRTPAPEPAPRVSRPPPPPSRRETSYLRPKPR
jgi:hypothetical protein